MGQTGLFAVGVLLMALVAGGGGNPVDSRAALMNSCETSQGIGWNKREYGEHYCEC